MMNIEDIKERTRISETGIYAHTYMRMLASTFPIMDTWKDIAELEDTYAISKDGEQRKEQILYKRAINQQEQQEAVLKLQTVSTEPLGEKKKAHFWSRHKEETPSQ